MKKFKDSFSCVNFYVVFFFPFSFSSLSLMLGILSTHCSTDNRNSISNCCIMKTQATDTKENTLDKLISFVCICMCAGAHVWGCMYVYVNMYVEEGEQLYVSSLNHHSCLPPFLFSEIRFLSGLELNQLSRLAVQRGPGVSLSLPHQC